jgi:hypothetical protein
MDTLSLLLLEASGHLYTCCIISYLLFLFVPIHIASAIDKTDNMVAIRKIELYAWPVGKD